METAKVFKNGRSQAVRIPKNFRFSTELVTIRKQGNSIILTPLSEKMTLNKFLAMPQCPDFELDRKAGLKEQKRDLF